VPGKCLRLAEGDSITFPLSLTIATNTTDQQFAIAFWVRDPGDASNPKDDKDTAFLRLRYANLKEDVVNFRALPGYSTGGRVSVTAYIQDFGYFTSAVYNETYNTTIQIFVLDAETRWQLVVMHRLSGVWGGSSYSTEPEIRMSVNDRVFLDTVAYNLDGSIESTSADLLTLQARKDASYTDVRDLCIFDGGGLTAEQVTLLYNQGVPADPRTIVGLPAPKYYLSLDETLADKVTAGTATLASGSLRYEE
jgi:hypothetical protein